MRTRKNKTTKSNIKKGGAALDNLNTTIKPTKKDIKMLETIQNLLLNSNNKLSNHNITTATKILNSYTREHTYNFNNDPIKFGKKKEWNNRITSLPAKNTQEYRDFKKSLKDSIEELKHLLASVPRPMNI